jgi:hypothetical protein
MAVEAAFKLRTSEVHESCGMCFTMMHEAGVGGRNTGASDMPLVCGTNLEHVEGVFCVTILSCVWHLRCPQQWQLPASQHSTAEDWAGVFGQCTTLHQQTMVYVAA